MPGLETLALFANAEGIVGYHGAGLVNTVFARAGTPVIEIISRHPSHRMFMHLSYGLGLPYWIVAADVPGNIFERTFAAPADDVGQTLASALKHARREVSALAPAQGR